MEERSSLGQLQKRIWRQDVRPFRRKGRQSLLIVVKIDAMFTPATTIGDQKKLASKQRMKRVNDSKDTYRTVTIRCN